MKEWIVLNTKITQENIAFIKNKQNEGHRQYNI